MRETPPDFISHEANAVRIRQSWDFGGRKPLLILVNKQTSLDWLIANCGMVRNPWNLQSNAAWLNLSETCNLPVIYFILTCSEVTIPPDFPFLIVIIFLSYATPANHGFTNTSAGWERHQTSRINGCYTQYVTLWHTARTETPASSLQCFQCGHQEYDRGCTFKNCSWNWKQQDYDTACNWMWVYSNHGKWRSTNRIIFSGYT